MLTTAQNVTLKAAILADPVLNAIPNTFDGAFAIADALNLLATPTFIVWRTNVPTSDVKKAVVWTEYVGRSVGEQGAFSLMISNGIIDASQINVRQGIQDIFSGPSGLNSRTALTAISKRSATKVEKILATGTGTDAIPAVMGFEGNISPQDTYAARNFIA